MGAVMRLVHQEWKSPYMEDVEEEIKSKENDEAVESSDDEEENHHR